MAMTQILIRDAVPEDAADILKIYAPYVEHTAITFEYEIPTEKVFTERIRNTLTKYPYIVAVDDGELVGYAYAGCFKERAAYDWAVELSIYIAQGKTRSGLGKQLYAELTTRLTAMGITNLYACIGYPSAEDDEYLDKNSAEFHAHLGFTLCGRFHRCGYKFGRWYDMIWMEKMVGDHPGSEQPVKWYPELKRG